jgi:hypothetical protein
VFKQESNEKGLVFIQGYVPVLLPVNLIGGTGPDLMDPGVAALPVDPPPLRLSTFAFATNSTNMDKLPSNAS